MKVNPAGAGLDERQLERITEHLQQRYIDAGRIAGCQVGTYLELVDLVQLTVDGYVKLHNRMYPLDAYDEAIADMRAGRLLGRAVLVP